MGSAHRWRGLSGLTVVSVSDTGVTFRWTSVTPNQYYNWTVTNDSAYTGNTSDANFVYYDYYTTDTFASQALLQPDTKYWIFVQKTQCPGLDSISFTTLPWDCHLHALQPHDPLGGGTLFAFSFLWGDLHEHLPTIYLPS